MKKYFDVKLFFILIGYILAYHVIFLLRGILLKLNEVGIYSSLSWKQITVDVLVSNLIMVSPVVVLILIVTKMMIDRQYKWRYIIGLHFLFSIAYVFILYVVLQIYRIISNEISVADLNIKEFFIEMITHSNLHFLGYVGFVGIIYTYYYFNRTAKIEVQRAHLSRQLTQAKMKALKSRLNPHFLFNTLHSISCLIKEDKNKAQSMTVNLADLLREVLLLDAKNKIPLHEEIKLLSKYIEIMRIRFSDHLAVDIKIEPELDDALIPSMLIQPIIENSFKHGFSYDSTELSIKLKIFRKKECLVIHVENDGKPIGKQESPEGTGIRNIIDRLYTLYNHNFNFNFDNLPNGKGVFTKITIPLQMQKSYI